MAEQESLRRRVDSYAKAWCQLANQLYGPHGHHARDLVDRRVWSQIGGRLYQIADQAWYQVLEETRDG